jgi:hypothetical protein
MLGKTLLAGVAVAAGVVLVRKRGAVKGLLPGRSSSEPASSPPPPAQAPPPISNYDASGPVENTSTPVPTPPPFQPPVIDEAAEEAAAAAEAANIGGAVSDYAGLEPGETADESLRPLMEAGEGEAEGQEIAEAELVDYAEPSAGDPIEAERQIDDVIEAQDDPFSGERPEATEPLDPADSLDAGTPGTPAPDTVETLAPGTAEEGAPTTGGSLSGLVETPNPDDRVSGIAPPPPPLPGTEVPADEKSANVWRTDPSPEAPIQSDPEQPTVEQPKLGEGGDDKPDGGSEWQTWSGRAADS